jgi:hypothetical protein
MSKQKVWVVEYTSWHCSEAFVELYHKEEDTKERFITLVKELYDEPNGEPTLEEMTYQQMIPL